MLTMSDETEQRKRHMNLEEKLPETTRTQQTMATNESSSYPQILNSMNPRWRNWFIRGVFTFVMLAMFVVFIYLGPLSLTVLATGIFFKCFQEIITIGHAKYQEYNLPLYRVLNWLFFSVSIIFAVGSNIIHYYPEFFSSGLPGLFATYHRMLTFLLYVLGFVVFVLTLKKDYYGVQFAMFGWTHITMFFLGSQLYLILQNIFEGVFWFLLPVSMVICNDIMAYLFGFFFGRTKLINLSPKKTWEGFLGAFASTVVWGLLFSYILTKFGWACYATQEECEKSPMFQLKDYAIPLLGWHIQTYPVMIHSIPLSIFASLIAPFGGFFASGFKRAFKIKDFADVIPGHGGLMDRFDCQLLMAVFSNVYYFTFCRAPNMDRVISLIFSLPADQQLEILTRMQNKLKHINSS